MGPIVFNFKCHKFQERLQSTVMIQDIVRNMSTKCVEIKTFSAVGGVRRGFEGNLLGCKYIRYEITILYVNFSLLFPPFYPTENRVSSRNKMLQNQLRANTLANGHGKVCVNQSAHIHSPKVGG